MNWDRAGDDFHFVFPDRGVYRVSSSIAEFLSPKVAHLRRCDLTFDTYMFDSDCSDLYDTLDTLVTSVRSGRTVHIEHSNFVPLLRLFHKLENSELVSSLLGIIKIETLTVHDAILFFPAEITHVAFACMCLCASICMLG